MSLTCSGFVKFLEGYKVGDPQEKGRGGAGKGGMTTLERPVLSAHKWIKSLRYTCCLMSAMGRPWASVAASRAGSDGGSEMIDGSVDLSIGSDSSPTGLTGRFHLWDNHQ